MRALILLALVPAVAFAQADEKAATIAFVKSLQDPETGAFAASAPKPGEKLKPGLRATNGGVRALRYLGAELPRKEKAALFVLNCYDPKTGTFAEPGGKADVTITAVGYLAAAELGVAEKRCAKAIEYLGANAKTFEEVRIAAAAVELADAWPAQTGEWFKLADAQLDPDGAAGKGDGRGRDTGSVFAMRLRLQQKVNYTDAAKLALRTPRADGGYGKTGEASELDSTYRVMRALMLLKDKPTDPANVLAFVGRCRNADGGYGVKPGEPSTLSGVYYAGIIRQWLAK